MIGTSLPLTKAATVAGLSARDGLQGVPVSDDGPTRLEDLQAEDGAYEAIWLLTDPSATLAVPVSGIPVTLDESYTLQVVIQVLALQGDDTSQAAADLRAAELLGEVLGFFAADPSLGIDPPDELVVFEAIPSKWAADGGWLEQGDQHGARFIVDVAVDARLQLS